jgi:hypothetical protein
MYKSTYFFSISLNYAYLFTVSKCRSVCRDQVIRDTTAPVDRMYHNCLSTTLCPLAYPYWSYFIARQGGEVGMVKEDILLLPNVTKMKRLFPLLYYSTCHLTVPMSYFFPQHSVVTLGARTN